MTISQVEPLRELQTYRRLELGDHPTDLTDRWAFVPSAPIRYARFECEVYRPDDVTSTSTTYGVRLWPVEFKRRGRLLSSEVLIQNLLIQNFFGLKS